LDHLGRIRDLNQLRAAAPGSANGRSAGNASTERTTAGIGMVGGLLCRPRHPVPDHPAFSVQGLAGGRRESIAMTAGAGSDARPNEILNGGISGNLQAGKFGCEGAAALGGA
jgi:hypothetical protein